MHAGEIKTRTGVVWMDRDLGILRFVYAQGSECSLEDAIENVDAEVKLAEWKAVPLLCDITKCRSISREARNHYGKSKAFCALALLGGTPVGNIIGNVFLAVYGAGTVPTKLFMNEPDAIQWLLGFKESPR